MGSAAPHFDQERAAGDLATLGPMGVGGRIFRLKGKSQMNIRAPWLARLAI